MSAIDYSGVKKVTFTSGTNAHDGHVANAGEEGFEVSTTTLSEQILKLPEKNYVLVCDIEGAELELSQYETNALSQIYLLILETHQKIYPNGDLDYQKIKKNLKNAGLFEIDRSGAVLCFASKKAIKDLNFNLISD